MTITIEREQLLTINTTSSWIHSNSDNDAFYPRIKQQKEKDSFNYSELIYAQNNDDDDEASLSSLSTTSTDSNGSSRCSVTFDYNRRVKFASEIITDVWTRPRTLREDVPKLFYSPQETQIFREEYRLEKEAEACAASNFLSPSNLGNKRRSISRVVIIHNDELKTFFNEERKSQETTDARNVVGIDDSGMNTNFDFDDDSFWSGELTWY